MSSTQHKIEAILSARDEGMTRALSRIETVLSELNTTVKKIGDIMIKAQDKASPKIEKVQEAAEGLSKTDIETKIEAVDKATPKVEKVKNAANAVAANPPKIPIEAVDKATSKIEKIKATASGIAKKPFEIIATIRDKATSKLDSIKTKAVAIAKNPHILVVQAKDAAGNILDGIKNKLKGLQKEADDTSRSMSAIKFGALMEVGKKGIGLITSQFSGFVGEMNSSSKAWKTFEGNMKAFGASSGEIERVRGTLSKFATESIYSASDMASTYSQLSAVGIKNCDKLVTGFGGLAAAAESPQQAMKTLSQQATQMAAKPTVAWADFKLMLEQTPAGIAAVAKQMGMTTSELISNVSEGTVATQDFFDAISAVGNNDAFGKMATQYKGVDEAMQGLMETLQVKLAPAFDKLSQVGINAISKLADAIDSFSLDRFSTVLNNVKKMWDNFKNGFLNTGAIEAVKTAFNGLGDMIGRVATSLSGDAANGAKTFGEVIGTVAKLIANAVTAIADFDAKTGGIAGKLAAGAGAVMLFGGSFNKLKSLASGALGGVFSLLKKALPNPFKKLPAGAKPPLNQTKSKVAQCVDSIGNMFKGIGTGISTAFKGVGKGISTAFRGISSAISSLNPVGVLAFAGVVATLTAAFLALAACKDIVLPFLQELADIMTGVLNTAVQIFVEALNQLAPILPIIAESLAKLSPLVTAFGEALSAVIAAIGTAIATIVEALTPVIEIIANMFTSIVQIIANAITQIISVLAPYIPEVTKMVEATSQAAQAICDAFTNLVNQVNPALENLRNIVETVFSGICDVLNEFKGIVDSVFDGVSGIFESFGNMVNDILSGVADIIDSIGNACLKAGEGFNRLGSGVQKIMQYNFVALGTNLGAVATGIGGISIAAAGLGDTGTQIQALGTGLTMIARNVESIVAASQQMPSVVQNFQSLGELSGPLLSASSSLTSFAASAMASGVLLVAASASMAVLGTAVKTCASSMSSLNGPVQAVSSALQGLGGVIGSTISRFSSMASAATSSFAQVGQGAAKGANLVKTALTQMIQAMTQAVGKAKTAGTQIGNGISNGVRSGMAKLPSIASSALSAMFGVLSGAQGRAYSCGVYIGQGLASGLNVSVGAVQAAAARLAAAADEAIRAKARINSPSKVTTEDGRYIGLGLVKGIEGTYRQVQGAIDNIMDLTAMAADPLAFAFAGGQFTQASDYSYGINVAVDVPLYVNGREFAKATSEDYEDVTEKRSKFLKKMKGER